MDDLKERGLLDSTLIVWMGEFGRTPQDHTANKGRDHWPNAWTTVLAGGGIKGGQAIGKTSADGTTVEERPVSVATSWPRLPWPWASIQRSKTTPTSAGRSASSKRAPRLSRSLSSRNIRICRLRPK